MIAPANGYSSEIEGHLLVGEQKYPLARLGPEAIGLRSPLTISPGNAEIVLTIDGRVNRMRVFLPEGSSLSSPFIPYRKLDEQS